MEMDKFFLRFDDFKYSESLTKIEEECETANELILGTLKRLGINPTMKILKDAVMGCNLIRSEYFKSIDADIQKLISPVLKDDMMKRAQETFDECIAKIGNPVLNHIDMIIIKNGKAYPDEENIKRSCEVWLTDPKEIEERRLHEKAADAINKFLNGKAPNNFRSVFVEKNGKVVPNEYTNYKYFI